MAPCNIRNAFVEQHLAERMLQISQYSFWQTMVHRGSIVGHKHGKWPDPAALILEKVDKVWTDNYAMGS